MMVYLTQLSNTTFRKKYYVDSKIETTLKTEFTVSHRMAVDKSVDI